MAAAQVLVGSALTIAVFFDGSTFYVLFSTFSITFVVYGLKFRFRV